MIRQFRTGHDSGQSDDSAPEMKVRYNLSFRAHICLILEGNFGFSPPGSILMREGER
jgi:hypothetical protein